MRPVTAPVETDKHAETTHAALLPLMKPANRIFTTGLAALIVNLLAGCGLVHAANPTPSNTATAQQNKPVESEAITVAARGSDVSASALGYSQSREAARTRQRHEQTLRALAETPGLTGRGIWGRLSREFTLPRDHPEIKHWARHYAAQQERIYGYLARGGPYIWYIEQQLRRQNMPLELVLLPLIESGYDPNAVSKSGAVGMWQFLPGTADRFKLARNWWYDGSRDFTASTAAALEYLTFLYSRFDDWMLAITAYNCGEGCVSRSLASSRTNSFWEIRIRKESREYAPKILGMAELVSNPDQYGFTLPRQEDGPQIELVRLNGQVNLQQAARRAGVEPGRIRELNAGFLRHSSPPGGPHRLVLPIGHGQQLDAGIASPPVQRAHGTTRGTTRHRVLPGETLNQIAARYGTSTSEIQRANSLRGNLIYAGQQLVVPGSTARQRPNAVRESSSARRTVHQVAPGDSLWYIAGLYAVRAEDVVRWNNLASATALKTGQRLTIYQPGDTREDDAVFYQVRVGDSLPVIASRFGVRVADLMRWNILQDYNLQPGQRLKILVPAGYSPGI